MVTSFVVSSIAFRTVPKMFQPGDANADATIMLERPKLREHIDAMRDNLAKTLDVDLGCVSVKAKTGEGLDAVGRGEAVSAQAVILLRQS